MNLDQLPVLRGCLESQSDDRSRLMLKQPSFYITESNYKMLVGNGFWAITDLPPDRWDEVRGFFGKPETLAVFASGNAPYAIPSHADEIAGIDWARIESNQKKGEPPINVYHYGIGQKDLYGYPVYGPVIGKTIARHWSELRDLDVYS